MKVDLTHKTSIIWSVYKESGTEWVWTRHYDWEFVTACMLILSTTSQSSLHILHSECAMIKTIQHIHTMFVIFQKPAWLGFLLDTRYFQVCCIKLLNKIWHKRNYSACLITNIIEHLQSLQQHGTLDGNKKLTGSLLFVMGCPRARCPKGTSELVACCKLTVEVV